MTLSDDKITEIFCLVDSFCSSFDRTLKSHPIGNPPKRKPRLSTSEVITIMILFHHSNYRTMKHFYMHYVKIHMSHLFDRVFFQTFRGTVLTGNGALATGINALLIFFVWHELYLLFSE